VVVVILFVLIIVIGSAVGSIEIAVGVVSRLLVVESSVLDEGLSALIGEAGVVELVLGVIGVHSWVEAAHPVIHGTNEIVGSGGDDGSLVGVGYEVGGARVALGVGHGGAAVSADSWDLGEVLEFFDIFKLVVGHDDIGIFVLVGDDGFESFEEDFVVSENFIEGVSGIQINQAHILELFAVFFAVLLVLLDHGEFLHLQEAIDLLRFIALDFFTLGFGVVGRFYVTFDFFDDGRGLIDFEVGVDGWDEHAVLSVGGLSCAGFDGYGAPET
jgi:hypothetical protein